MVHRHSVYGAGYVCSDTLSMHTACSSKKAVDHHVYLSTHGEYGVGAYMSKEDPSSSCLDVVTLNQPLQNLHT